MVVWSGDDVRTEVGELVTLAMLTQWRALAGRQGEETKMVRCDFCTCEADLDECVIDPYFDLVLCRACREAPTLPEDLP